jgi:hypothetical protein
MSGFKKKRESLELFVKEQIIGPGAFNKRYFFIEKFEANEFFDLDIKSTSVRAFDNKSEVLTEVPAYQYSSAILFPETRTKLPKGETVKLASISTDDEDIDDNETEEVNKGADDDNIKDDSGESLVSKQQNYPNSLGLSFVVNKDTDLQKDLTVSISFRKYFNINKEVCLVNKLSCLVTEYDTEIESTITKYYAPIFSAIRKDKNLFVTINSIISNEDLYMIDYQLTNNFIKEKVLPVIKEVFRDRIIELNEKNGIKYFGLLEGDKTYEIYSIAESNKYGFFNVVTLFDERIISYLQLQLNLDLANYINFKDLIQTIEIYNQIKNYVTDLKSVYKPKNGSPVWESKSYDDIQIGLPTFESAGNVFRSKELLFDAENKEISDLKYLVQYIRKNDEIFVKIILLNKGSILLKENEPTQLNKKDEANKKAFFGVKILVEEKKEKQLKQYNPPQLLDFDEEDNFNKLLYRNYHDFGEGYNTSVIWGKYNRNLNYISTEFLPEQETPKVDFKPSKINEKGKVISRLNARSESVLSIRYLSTLSSTSDEDVLEGLKDFVNEYKTWIDEKRKELKEEPGLQSDQVDLLFKQLLACENDYNRLIRNIKLLKVDLKAIAAFRMMNTAMFMQLHHSILKKKKSTDLSEKLSEDYYKNVKLYDDKGNETEYKWRSFQIAFILLNIDAFVKPDIDDKTVGNIFSKAWPERNEIADLVWFPTGGGKTEAYLGIIAFVIGYRRFVNGPKGNGTTVLMRYTLRLLTLQQFQRATLLICALEIIRKDEYKIPHKNTLGEERISIGLFVGATSLPNKWQDMENELSRIKNQIENAREISTNLPFTDCPWCGTNLFIENELNNVSHKTGGENYGINNQLSICCNNTSCSYKGMGRNRPTKDFSLPFRLFDEDIYKFPPTLLFGTVDKFAALANNVSSDKKEIYKDSRRLFGRGYNQVSLPPELIIQDELHLLLGPLGSAVGLFEKSIDYLCTYEEKGLKIKPKIVTSTATTRNTDKQIFALFNRRSEIFPKQGILSDDSFFAYYERNENKVDEYLANRKYIGILPVGKTQVWMQLRIASIALAHRLKYLKQCFTNNEIFERPEAFEEYKVVFDYYHTVLSYFNSLKDVGKTQSQLSHYLPGDVNFVIKNTTSWSFLDKLIRDERKIEYSELTGRLSGEEVKSNLSNIEKKWSLILNENAKLMLNSNNPPEFVISTNMISVGIDVSRFNTMIISSMPRNIAEYIQASSRVARSVEGIVFTVHHPFRSRDISHFQKFKEFHEKFYSYVEPISVTPFASKAMERYLAMYLSVMIRHNSSFGLMNNTDASSIDDNKIELIKKMITDCILEVKDNAVKLNTYLNIRIDGFKSSVDGIITDDEVIDLSNKLDNLLHSWITRLQGSEPQPNLEFRNSEKLNESLFITSSDDNYPTHWKVGYSLREIDPSVVIKTVQQ